MCDIDIDCYFLWYVGHNYTRFVFFLAKTFFEIGCWAALVPLYEVLKTTISSLVKKNQFVHAFTCTVNYVFLSGHVYSLSNNTVVNGCS